MGVFPDVFTDMAVLLLAAGTGLFDTAVMRRDLVTCHAEKPWLLFKSIPRGMLISASDESNNLLEGQCPAITTLIRPCLVIHPLAVSH
jgi:hypothetical protein